MGQCMQHDDLCEISTFLVVLAYTLDCLGGFLQSFYSRRQFNMGHWTVLGIVTFHFSVNWRWLFILFFLLGRVVMILHKQWACDGSLCIWPLGERLREMKSTESGHNGRNPMHAARYTNIEEPQIESSSSIVDSLHTHLSQTGPCFDVHFDDELHGKMNVNCREGRC